MNKLPKGKVTVADLITRLDVRDVLADVNKNAGNLEEILVIGTDDHGDIIWRHSAVPPCRLILLMEVVKKNLLEE